MRIALSLSLSTTLLATLAMSSSAAAQIPPGESPALGFERTQQFEIEGGGISLLDLRKAGLKMFSTPFNKLDGYGDGPVDFVDPTGFGHRPTLQNNGTFLRVNGLDAQTCMECHSVGSNATAPFTFAIGGAGGSNNNAIFMPRNIDVSDQLGVGHASFDGRYINPPFLFGSGGVELLAKEMTQELQTQKARAAAHPDVVINLVARDVHFGTLVYDSKLRDFDYSGVEGVDHDLVVKPFGRKGELSSVRAFDIDAMQFHFGMQPVEVVGQDVDDDGDGVTNEILVGELSALHIFNTNLERPTQDPLNQTAKDGFRDFLDVGCATCHKPFLNTRGTTLNYTFPEVATDPTQNVFYASDLSQGPASFPVNGQGGLQVPLFADLKRHDMGPGLAEDFGNELDSEFTTARLWGIADTAPYLHDGRATTLTEAIMLHGGEAEFARDNFAALPDANKVQLLTFLRTLRTPVDPASDLL
ncbi:MAG: hypothetical protein DHS20C15_31630 [Planctomycetota bacterium]|nr:MAG: hypothetical protein DHS20C15_31630 [Planctomycetota bacterium]